MTTCCAASPSSAPLNSPCAASMAVCRDSQMMTPLPACSPSALTTMGGWKKSMAFSTRRRWCSRRVVAGGNVVPLQNCLAKALAALEHGRGARGPKDAQAALLQGIHNAQRERQLRPDDGQGRLLGLGQAHHGGHILQVDRNAARNLRHAAVAGRANNFRNSRLRLTAQASACSRPPEPRIRTFMSAPSKRAKSEGPKGNGRQCGAGEVKPEMGNAETPVPLRRNQVFGLLLVAAAI
jgi:hypothetical protein